MKTKTNQIQLFFPFSSSDERIMNQFIQKKMRILNDKYHLNGFYKVIVYNRFFGTILQLYDNDSSFYRESFDYRIVYDSNCKVYFKTEDFFVVEQCFCVYYYDDYYYGLVDDSFNQILEKVEFGSFVVDNELEERALLIKSE